MTNTETDSGAEPVPLSLPARQAVSLLRDLIPHRRVSFLESMQIAERQAVLLRELFEDAGAQFAEQRLGLLPKLAIWQEDGIPVSGASFWDGGQWVININTDEPPERQRFTLLHEFKHVIDHPHQVHLFSPAQSTGNSQRELAADYFAACVLMPSRQFKAAHRRYDGAVDRLAEHFGVHRGGILMRLSELGIAQHDRAENPSPIGPSTGTKKGTETNR